MRFKDKKINDSFNEPLFYYVEDVDLAVEELNKGLIGLAYGKVGSLIKRKDIDHRDVQKLFIEVFE